MKTSRPAKSTLCLSLVALLGVPVATDLGLSAAMAAPPAAAEGKAADAKPAEGKAGEAKAPEGKAAEPKAAGGAPADGKGPAAGPAPGGPPVSITSVRAQQRDLPIYLQAPGTVTPVSTVDIRAQVTSVVTQVHVKEGQFVRKGDLLYTLDTRADEANVAKARAQLARDEASLADAQRQLARSRQLVERNFVSQGAVETAQAQVDAQTALVASDKAAIDAALVPLSYGRVIAPGNGRIGVLNVFAGSAVQANLTSMTTLTQLDPITVAFNLPQRYLASVLGLLKKGNATVKVVNPEKNLALTGRLSFVDTNVDSNSGTVKAKATFDNKNTALWPGAFLNVSVQIDTLKEAIVIPQSCIIQTVRGSIVYVIDKDNKAAIRPVKIVESQGEEAAVSGLRPGERIAQEGRQNLRPGSTAIERPRDPARAGGKGGDRAGKGPDKAGGPAESGKGPDKAGVAGDGGKSADKASAKGEGKSEAKGDAKSPDKTGGKTGNPATEKPKS